MKVSSQLHGGLFIYQLNQKLLDSGTYTCKEDQTHIQFNITKADCK